MNYDDAVQLAQPSIAIKQKFFSDFIEPYLKVEPKGQHLAYWLDQGWHAWRTDVKKRDIKNMLFVEKMCGQLYAKLGDEFAELVSVLLDETHDARVKTHNSEKIFYEATGIEDKFISAVRHYKVYFETQFRLWGTIPFFYASKMLGLKSSGSDPDTYVKISASTKFYMLKNIQTVLPEGDVKDLVEGFDTELRNAGDGHESYELTDNDTILMHVLNPRTGKEVGSKRIELTYGELDKMIKLCRKSIWILRNGLTLFLNNNPEFKKKLKSTRPIKISEIKSSIEVFADDRRLIADKLTITKDRKQVSLSLKFKRDDSVGRGGELLFGNGERYDIVNIKTTLQAKYQIISIFQYITYIFKEGNTPNISAEILNENGETIANLEYEPKELSKFFLGKKEEYIPIPKSGIVPNFQTHIISEVKVPYGLKNEAIIILTSKGYNVVG